MITKIIDGNEENVSGGSAGGGHVIKNQSGTDMAQRANLQFIDATLADDSTNNRTKVEMVKELANASELASQPDGLYLVPEADPTDINAESVGYDNTDSELQSTNVQNAIDEVASEKIDKTAVSSIETTNTAVAAHAINTYFINSSGQLVKATSAIAIGDTISRSNTTVTTVTDALESANNAITQLNNNIDIKDTVLRTDGQLYLQRNVLNVVTNHTGYIRDKLIGGSVAWNQLVQNGNFATGDLTNWAGIATASVSNNTITVTSSGVDDKFIYQDLTTRVVPSHKYIFSVEGYSNVTHQSNRNGGIEMYLGDVESCYYITFDTTNKTYNIICNTSNNIQFATLRLYSYNDHISYFRNIQLIDLTLAFGSTIADYIYGEEQTTAGSGIAWLKSQGFLTKSYYDYSTGSLISVKPESKKIVGKNFDSAVNEISAHVTVTNTDTGYRLQSTSSIMWSNYKRIYKLSKNLDFTISSNITIASGHAAIIISGSNSSQDPEPTSIKTVNFDSGGKKEVSFNSGNYEYIYIAMFDTWDSAVSGDVTYSEFMLRDARISDSTYEPYHETIYQFDNSKEYRGIPKLDENNLLYYDGDIYESNGKVTRKYGIVDLGTLNWLYSTTIGVSPFFYATMPATVPHGGTGICQKSYQIMDPNTFCWTAENYSMTFGYIIVSNAVHIKDESYTDPTAFKAAMSGVYLVYELATPTTEYVTPFADPMSLIDATIEEYEDNRSMPVPPGHETQYMGLSDKSYSLPSIPRSNGKWLLGCDVSNGEARFDMVPDVTKELTERISTNAFGTPVDLTSYSTFETMYTFPTDGYIGSFSEQGGGFAINMYGSNVSHIFNYWKTLSAYTGDWLFVKKGMKCVVTSSTNCTVGFYPLR